MSGTETRLDNYSLNDVPVSTWLIPAEKARALTYIVTFNAGVNFFHTDLTNSYESGRFTTFQTVYIDNSLNSSAASISVDQTQQLITAPPFSQGYYPIQAPMSCRVTFTSLGTVNVTYILLNVPVSAVVWFVASSGVAAVVSDPILEAAIGTAAPGTAPVSMELVGGKYLAAGETLANGQSSALQLTSTGALIVTTTPATLDPTYKPIAPGTAAVDEQQVGGVYNSGGITLTTGQGAALQMNATGALLTSDTALDTSTKIIAPSTASSTEMQVGGVFTLGGITLTNGQGAALQQSAAGALLTSDAALDSSTKVIGPATAAADEIQVGGVYNSAGITLTNGQGAALQQSATGTLLVQDSGSGTGAFKVITASAAAVNEMQVGGVYDNPPISLVSGQGAALQLDSRGGLRTGGAGSADLARPIFSVMQGATVNASLNAAGATLALLTGAPGFYIEDLQISLVIGSTAAGTVSIKINDNAVAIADILVLSPVTASVAGFYYQGILKKYLSPNNTSPLTLTYTAIGGVGGSISCNFTYALTSQQGP
jgi:hypothetical protein